MESTGEIVSKLTQPSSRQQSAIDKFINSCGNIPLLSDKGIEHIDNLRLGLQMLYKNTQPNVMTLKSYDALGALIIMLNKMTADNDGVYQNNNYNFFNNSPEAKKFYDIAFPHGASTPEINDDLAASIALKLLDSLQGFSPWKHLKGPIYVAYKFFPGDPIETAKKDLKDRIDHYHQIDKDKVLLIAFANIANKLNQLSRSPPNSDPIVLKAKYLEIADRLNEANFQFAHEQTPGLHAVASGVLLPQILACQETLVNKCGIPLQDLASIPVVLPKPTDHREFEAHLLEYCRRLESNIDLYFDKKKDVKQDKASLLKYLRLDIQTQVNEIKCGKTTLADGCLVIYNAVADAVSKHHQIAAGKSTSIDLLNNALSEIKGLMGYYSLGMSVRGLKLPQEKLARPESSPQHEAKQSVSPIVPRK